MAGDGLDPGDERALVVRKEIEGHLYGTTSGTLVALVLGRGPLRVHRHSRRAGLVVRGPGSAMTGGQTRSCIARCCSNSNDRRLISRPWAKMYDTTPM